MQVICIYAGVVSYEQKIDYVVKIFKNTLAEIGLNVEIIDILKIGLSYYNGAKQPIMEKIFDTIREAQGVIFATTAQRLAPSGAMQVFLEHIDYNVYPDVLLEKPCISIVTSYDDSEYIAGNYLNTLISKLGGVATNNMLIGKGYLEDIEKSMDITQMIERYAEDFCRIVKQNRKFFVPNFLKPDEKMPIKDNYVQAPIIPKEQAYPYTEDGKQIRNLTGPQVANLYKREISDDTYKRPNYRENIHQKYSKYQRERQPYEQTYNKQEYAKQKDNQQDIIKNFNSQKEDIDEIVKLLENKYEQDINDRKEINAYMSSRYEEKNKMTPNLNSIRQKTSSLPHYFQPQLAKDVDLIMQMAISGYEIFSGYITIKNGECIYTNGVNPSPDVTILSDSEVWKDVLDRKITLQKAFMLGKLKIKGNFVIISKFEQYFKI